MVERPRRLRKASLIVSALRMNVTRILREHLIVLVLLSTFCSHLFRPGLFLLGGGSGLVTDAQGARVTPSTIPLGGFIAEAAHGVDVPGPATVERPGEAVSRPGRALESAAPKA